MRVPRTDGLLPDRYVEIDLDWFPPRDQRSVGEFVERAAPLWHGRRGERGVVLNPGFLVDILTEFSGGGPEAASLVVVEGAWGNRDCVLGEHGADWLDPEAVPVRADEIHDYRSLRSSSAWAKKADAVLRISLAFSSRWLR